jgi:hypothetical protein
MTTFAEMSAEVDRILILMTPKTLNIPEKEMIAEMIADTTKEMIADTTKEMIADTTKEMIADTTKETIQGIPEKGMTQDIPILDVLKTTILDVLETM